MAAEQLDTTWMWHPSFTEERTDTAGLFVHFRRDIVLGEDIPQHFRVRITADTRYKLYINSRLVCFGPVKGDLRLWFYDEVDIAPYLKPGVNHVRVLVLRFFYATQYAASFPRGPVGGLRIALAGPGSGESPANQVRSSPGWETAVDRFATLRVDEPEDDFLHVYERVTSNDGRGLEWVAATMLKFQRTTGVSPPWHLSPRMIPQMRLQNARFCSIQNIESALPRSDWETLLQSGTGLPGKKTLRQGMVLLPAGSSHRLDLEAPHHMTGFLAFRFGRTSSKGSVLKVRYAESYEDEPRLIPYLRRKDNRCDYRKRLFGPQDVYAMSGTASTERLHHYEDEELEEIFSPFHFRTFRFLQITLDVGPSDLVFNGIDVEEATYPLDVVARLDVPGPDDMPRQLWSTSIRTLANCMHDTYEDFPLYEQLQYALDTRSSILFTYYTSGDDRLARQAIIQLRNSFDASIGLTSSRAPSHKPQIIPHFSLFWIAMLTDHWTHFGDAAFLAPFAPVVDAVLGYFHSRIDPGTGLVTSEEVDGIWNFVDWTEEWRPYGVPPAAVRTRRIDVHEQPVRVHARAGGAAGVRAGTPAPRSRVLGPRRRHRARGARALLRRPLLHRQPLQRLPSSFLFLLRHQRVVVGLRLQRAQPGVGSAERGGRGRRGAGGAAAQPPPPPGRRRRRRRPGQEIRAAVGVGVVLHAAGAERRRRRALRRGVRRLLGAVTAAAGEGPDDVGGRRGVAAVRLPHLGVRAAVRVHGRGGRRHARRARLGRRPRRAAARN